MTFKFILLISVLAFIFSSCENIADEQGADALYYQLVGRTMNVEPAPDAAFSFTPCTSPIDANISEGDSSAVPNRLPAIDPTPEFYDNSPFAPGMNADEFLALSKAQTTSDVTFVFGKDHVIMQSGGAITEVGTWETVDKDTIAITLNDVSVEVDVDLQENVLLISLADATADFNCSSQLPPAFPTDTTTDITDEMDPTPNIDFGIPEQEPEAEPLFAELIQGTWCYESGYPYYLAIKILNEGPYAFVAYAGYNQEFIDGQTFQLHYTTRSFGIHPDAESAWIATYAVLLQQDEVENIADIEFTNSQEEKIKITFASGLVEIFVPNDFSQEVSCADVEVSFNNFSLLP